ncbi:MAG: hypothetical protein ABIB79_01515 [archaeon]
MRSENLIGKSMVDVILALPEFDWLFNDNGSETKTKIRTLTFVDYEKKKPRKAIDLYQPIGISKLSLEELEKYNLIGNGDEKRLVGLTSKVTLGEPYQEEEHKFAHIPMIDFDKDKRLNLSNEKLRNIITRTIKEGIGLKGLLLKSSHKDNYHFISTERLLDEEGLITFCGLCLTMKYKNENGESINLFDSRHIGHTLSPMKYIVDLSGEKNWQPYDFKERFITLRLTPKNPGEPLPKVVEVVK